MHTHYLLFSKNDLNTPINSYDINTEDKVFYLNEANTETLPFSKAVITRNPNYEYKDGLMYDNAGKLLKFDIDDISDLFSFALNGTYDSESKLAGGTLRTGQLFENFIFNAQFAIKADELSDEKIKELRACLLSVGQCLSEKNIDWVIERILNTTGRVQVNHTYTAEIVSVPLNEN